MLYIRLQEIAKEIKIDNPNWDVVNNSFSHQKTLFDYQERALQYAVNILWKYFEDLKGNKVEFSKYYSDLEIINSLNIPLKGNKYAKLLKEFFSAERDHKGNEVIPFSEISNRMSFWMATGSGKTLVIVKLIEILHKLMKINLIPKKEIMFLTYREDLLDAFKRHVKEYNEGKPIEEQIKLVNLKDYEKEKSQIDFSNRVFYYRADLISCERKENIVNFEDYLELQDGKRIGNWYLILDEAHKGDKQDSKRQHLFSILSQNGFLFNFSATFTQHIDIVTTVFNFNLNQFIKEGYGKQIYVTQEEVNVFKGGKDFNQEAKRRIILKTLLTLTLIKKAFENVKGENIYHNPLGIYLVNSVNTEDADLKLVFKELAEIAKNISDDLFQEVKEELEKELENAKYTIGDKSNKLACTKQFIGSITKDDVYKFVFNSATSGNIEYIVNPNNKQEIVLKLDSSERAFALIKIGDIHKWIKENLKEYKENESFKDESYFEILNNIDSPVNLLLGSRAFYEGWDSNRPNVITFINIGTGEEARKFVLQSIGRGVRIEPINNERKRMEKLSINDKDLKNIFDKHKEECIILETLFVYATNKNAVETILNELNLVLQSERYTEVSLWKNEKAEQLSLLIPSYKEVDKNITDLPQGKIPKFRMSKANLELLKLYFKLMPKEKFLLEYDSDLETYNKLIKIVNKNAKYIKEDEARNYRDVSNLIKELMSYLKVKTQEPEEFIPVNDKIVHFRKIKVRIDLENKFREKAEKVKNSVVMSDEELFEKIKRGEITVEEYKDLKVNQANIEFENVKIRKLLQHFYIPIVYTYNERVEWIKHIIKVKSEYEFIEALVEILDKMDKRYDWWMFSKIDEHLDKDIYIPYVYNGKIEKFIPDFIFWLKKENEYTILFIDPKGGAHSDYLAKLDGYKSIFEEQDREKIFETKDGLRIKVKLKLYNENLSKIPGDEYRRFWCDKDGLKKELLS